MRRLLGLGPHRLRRPAEGSKKSKLRRTIWSHPDFERSTVQARQRKKYILHPLRNFPDSHFSSLPRVYSTFLDHSHLLRLSRSDIDRERGIEFGPFRSLREILLINQKVL